MSCTSEKDANKTESTDFQFFVEQFADLKILRYPVLGFDDLNLKQKELLYYLSQAAIEGRDIMFDQNYKYNLAIRRTLEAIYEHYEGDRSSDQFKAFEVYLKRVWFSNGIHHHYSSDKFLPDFDEAYFGDLIVNIDDEKFPVSKNEIIKVLLPIMFNPEIDAKRVNQSEGVDMIATSANNYWGNGITQAEAEDFYAKMKDPNDQEPVSYGLNSRLE
ncbi:MAG TPA: dihydrofolate reductase, partial [Prolixibacteraceae bacterium]|nr:dihydrofolate reductase [Prolixibacteraceae bacterium]